jgi:DNA processing protein
MKINTISPQDSKFTQIMSTIASCPEKLYFVGKLPDERRATVAIVGTRKPTTYGKEVTYRLAYDLARRGIIIVSGMALGVDGIAHRATIDAGGTTLAVLANGVDIIYPATNKQLAQDILKSGGAIISEYEPGTEARDFQFLARNRIVSGLSDAVIVTEAAVRSGTLSTVMHALEQGREVFVVPGNITSPLSAGCNNLIKQGAHPITCAEDVLEIIAPDLLQPQALLPLGNTPMESKIIRLLQSGIRDGDELQNLSEVGASEFSQTITMMEIYGTIRALGGNQWTLR